MPERSLSSTEPAGVPSLLLGGATPTMLQVRQSSFSHFEGTQQTLTQRWADVEPASQTMGQHQPNIGPMPHVCWVVSFD